MFDAFVFIEYDTAMYAVLIRDEWENDAKLLLYLRFQ